MRRLAADLGVEAMSLYHWFPNKASIVEGVVEAVIREMAQFPVEWSDSPTEVLTTMAQAYHRALLAHPNAFAVLAVRPITTIDGLRGVEQALEALRRAGFSPVQAISAVRTVGAYVLGAVAVQLAQLDDAWPDSPAPPRELPTFPVASLPATEFPRIHEVADAYAHQPWTADDLFAQGLEAVVTGLVLRVTAQPPVG